MSKDTNVCIRFCLGNTDLSLVKGLERIMEEHPVIAWIDLYFFGFYGRPADIVEAVIQTFYVDPIEAAPEPTKVVAELETSVAPHQQQQAQDETHQRSTTSKGEKAADSDSVSSLSDSSDAGKTTASVSPLNTRRIKLPRHQWKTDYDLRLQQKVSSLSTMSSTKQSLRHRCTFLKKKQLHQHSSPHNHNEDCNHHTHQQNQQHNYMSLMIYVVLPENIRLFLLALSGGFASYLVGEASVEDCYRKGGLILKDLFESRDTAGIKVSDSQEYGMTLIEAMDLEPLRQILLGITTALAKDPVREYMRKWLQEEHSRDLVRWDEALNAYRAAHLDTSVRWIINGEEQEDDDEDDDDDQEEYEDEDYEYCQDGSDDFWMTRNRDPWGEQSSRFEMANAASGSSPQNTSRPRTPLRDIDAFIGEY